jgi:hypothetical protein
MFLAQIKLLLGVFSQLSLTLNVSYFKYQCVRDLMKTFIFVVFVMCTGINEVDGYEGVVTLDVMVLQVRRVHADLSHTDDLLLPRQSRWFCYYQLHQCFDNLRLPSALLSLTHQLLFRSINILCERSVSFGLTH